MAKKQELRGGKRFRKAYGMAFRVIWSYATLYFGKRIWGQAYFDRHIEGRHRKNADRVKKTILELKGLFIKVGQMLSILTNYLPAAFQEPLEAMQDQIPPRPYEEVEQRFLREMGKTPQDLFKTFEKEPIAAASIGQVHQATLQDGTLVAVKVQHADIEEIAKVDLAIIKRLSGLLAWFFEIKGMDFLYTQLRKMIEEELDFRKEAGAMNRVAASFADWPQIAVPVVYSELSNQRILTTQWHTGIKINRTKQLDALKINREELASNLLKAYCHMVFDEGFYHADPHPGNLLVEPDGRLVLLDFGATGSLSPNMRSGMLNLIEAAVRNDSQGIIAAFRQMGFLAEGREAEEMVAKVIHALRNFIQNEIELDGLNFKDIKVNPFENSLFRLIQEIGIGGITGSIQVPKDYVLLNRMLTQLLGLCNAVAPDLNPLDVVRPFAQKFLAGEKGDWISFARKMLQGTLTSLISLPDELRQTMQLIRDGKVEYGNPDLRRGNRLWYVVIQQLIFLALGLATGWYWLEHEVELQPLAHKAIGLASIGSFILFLIQVRRGNRLWRSL
jgi:predicted unusual protein kinase regulating ubiquinone biosynthesis (AarF/ABC1/UbiB family)